MTPEEHNKYLGVAHLVYGGIFLLFMIGMMAFFWVMSGEMLRDTNPNGPPPGFFFFIFGFMFFVYGLMIIPSFVAGYSLLKRKRWAKIASIIGGVVAGMNFPLGTAVCVYTLWFLFSEPGKLLYDRPARSLPPPPTWASEEINRRERQYQPPDWR